MFWSYMNFLYIFEAKIHALMKWSYRSPQSCWLLSLEWLAHSKHVLQSLSNTKSFWCPFVDPHLTPYHQNIGVQIIAKLELGMSTLHCLHGQMVFNTVKCIIFVFSKQYECISISVDMFGLAFFNWHVRCNPSPYTASFMRSNDTAGNLWAGSNSMLLNL